MGDNNCTVLSDDGDEILSNSKQTPHNLNLPKEGIKFIEMNHLLSNSVSAYSTKSDQFK